MFLKGGDIPPLSKSNRYNYTYSMLILYLLPKAHSKHINNQSGGVIMELELRCDKCGNDLEVVSKKNPREDVKDIWIVKAVCNKCDTTIFLRVAVQTL